MAAGGAAAKSAFAVLLAALVGLNVWLLARDIDVTPIADDGAPRPAATDLAPAATTGRDVPDLADLDETRTRPLFDPSRRPAVETSAEQERAPPPEQASAEGLRLVGIMRQGTAPKKALIRMADARAAQWVAIGTEIGGWRLAEIGPGGVTIERGDERVELKLHAQKDPGNDEISPPSGSADPPPPPPR